jgi:hypothetical protein
MKKYMPIFLIGVLGIILYSLFEKKSETTANALVQNPNIAPKNDFQSLFSSGLSILNSGGGQNILNSVANDLDFSSLNQ